MIRFDSFSKQYGRVRAVDRLSLSIGPGEVVALLGPNGSGKTTSLKAAAGLIAPSSGHVFAGLPERPASDPQARRVISYLPQKVSFPDALTGREVIEFYRKLRGADPPRAEQVLRLASLNGASARHVGTYSGGMVQRLGLAVAALPEAEVMLLDEPTAALDPEGLEAFYGLVERRRGAGQSVLFTSHQLGDAERLADRFAVMVGGRLAAVLSQAELSRRMAAAGSLHLDLTNVPPGFAERLRLAAPGAEFDGGHVVIPCPPEQRMVMLDLVRQAGATITEMRTEEGSMEQLYRSLVGDA